MVIAHMPRSGGCYADNSPLLTLAKAGIARPITHRERYQLVGHVSLKLLCPSLAA